MAGSRRGLKLPGGALGQCPDPRGLCLRGHGHGDRPPVLPRSRSLLPSPGDRAQQPPCALPGWCSPSQRARFPAPHERPGALAAPPAVRRDGGLDPFLWAPTGWGQWASVRPRCCWSAASPAAAFRPASPPCATTTKPAATAPPNCLPRRSDPLPWLHQPAAPCAPSAFPHRHHMPAAATTCRLRLPHISGPAAHLALASCGGPPHPLCSLPFSVATRPSYLH